MKRFSALCLSLIFVLALCVPAYGEQLFMLDPYTGEVITGSDGKGNYSTTNYAMLTSSCCYDKTKGLYILNYSGSADSTHDIACSVYKGMVTTDPVKISIGSLADVSVYRDGEEVSEDTYLNLTDTGSYLIRDNSTGTEVGKFVIVPQLTSLLNSYPVPNIFYVSQVLLDGENVAVTNNDVSLKEEGHYVIVYGNDNVGKTYTLTLDIDHTAPQLLISGVEDGVARSAVSFGELEDESTLVIKKDGSVINYNTGELKDAGDYVVYYSDKAGNTVTYAFTIKVFLDSGAWIYVGIIAALIIAALVYMFYSRKHLRAF